MVVKRKVGVKKIIRTYKRGYLKTLSNPKGKKLSLNLGEGLTGWGAVYSGSKKSIGKSNYRSPEKLAESLIKKGHKKVTILD